MRIGRFSGLRSAHAPMPLHRLLAVDFRAADDGEGAAVAGERAQAVAASLPLLIVSHLVWAVVLVAALVPAVALAALLPFGAVALDLALRDAFARPDLVPHRAMRWSAVQAAGSGGLCAAAAILLPQPVPTAACFALVAAAGATISAFFEVPGLVMIGCAAALATAASLGIAPPLLGVGAASGLLLCWRSLLRAGGQIVRAEARTLRDAEAGKARRFVAAFEASGRGWFWETNADCLLTHVSAELARPLGVAAETLLGRRFDQLLHSASEEGEEIAPGGLRFHLSARLPFDDLVVHAAAGDCWWSLSGQPDFDPYGRFLGFRGVAANLSEQRRSEAERARLASTDGLTGLPNREMMRRMLDDAIANAAARRKGCALMLIDLDRFKQVNDTLGHPVGDKLLVEVAQRLRETLGGDGQAGRIGGDEFQAILPDAAEEGRLAALAARLIATLSRPYAIEGHAVSVGASIGIAIASPGKARPEGLIKQADLALYAAKADGRGTHRFFSGEMHDEAAERRVLADDLGQALARGELHLLYQPMVASVSLQPVGFEALLRWHHPVRGLVPPLLVVALAEEAGLIGRIGDWAIRSACAEAATWPPHLRVSVNLSPLQLSDPALPAIVTGAIAAAGIDAGRLELEIGEAALGDDGAAARLARLRDIGVRVALDNFGAGPCSLADLRDAPVDTIKIDRFLVQAAGNAADRNAAVVRAIVVLAESLGMDNVAVGTETAESLALVRRLGCAQVQGFACGEPMPAGEASALVARGRSGDEGADAGAGRPPRHRLIRTGTLRAGEEALAVRLRNISEGGAMVECDRAFAPETRVALDLDAAGQLPAEIRWCQRGQIGLKFDQGFRLARLAYAPRGASPTMLKPAYLQSQAEPVGAPEPPRAARVRKKR